MREVFALPIEKTEDAFDGELQALLEAARRANWDALHGPRYLRTGRYRPTRDFSSVADEPAPPGPAAQQAAAADEPVARG